MIGENSSEIIKVFIPKDAPTGAKPCYKTADGRIWRPIEGNSNNADYPGTGETVGRKIGNRIEVKR